MRLFQSFTYPVSIDVETVMVVSPVDQLYVEAPVAVNAVELPAVQMVCRASDTDNELTML